MTKDSKHSIARLALALAGGLAATTALAIKITIGGGGDARDVDLKAAYDFNADPASTAATYIVPRGTPKNVQKVAIASLCVSVANARSVTGDSGPFTASASTPFPGTLDSARLAEVLDGFRKQLVADLRAGGITVLEPGELAALPTFQKLAAKMTTDPFEIVDSGEIGKGTWSKTRMQVVSAGGQPMLKDCRALTPGTMMTIMRAVYEKDLDGIMLLSGAVTLDFAKAKAAGGFFRGAKADFEYGQYVVPGVEQTAFAFLGKSGGGTLWLKQAIVSGENPFATGDTTRTKMETKLNNEYDINSGTTTTSGSKTTLGANMDLWYSNSANSLKALSGMLVHALKNPK